jgi:manganese transport protein
MLRATRLDVVLALILAGGVNIAMLLLAASTLGGVSGTDTIAGAHTAIVATLGTAIGVLFAVGLLASGLASSAVGSYAGSEIMAGLLHVRVPVMLRRVLTAIPALVILALGVAPTTALVVSQVVLSFGIPFALVPLVRLTSDRALMGAGVNRRPVALLAWLAVLVIVVLNLVLIGLTVAG